MNEQIERLREFIIEASKSPDFVHKFWFIKYHLEIAEKIALELCDIYPAADRDLVRTMIWMHDYGKIIDFPNQHERTLTDGPAKMLELGFPQDFTDKVIDYIDRHDKKIDLEADTTPIEIKIVSSADGASHFVGPFYVVYAHEHPEIEYPAIMDSNLRRAEIDWGKKIVLPEAKQAFAARHRLVLEQNGILPDKYLN